MNLKIMKNYSITLLFFFFVSFCMPSQYDIIYSDSYIPGDDGIIRMNINIIGHVKNPGTYLVYDGIDLISAISMAGGYLVGANLSNIKVISENGTNNTIDLKQLIKGGVEHPFKIDLLPNDTIIIDQKSISRLLYSSNFPMLILSFLNLAITLEKN
tara:strand:- start:1527 stop:1994 length:468 start_codon:yes stop_codon:yes gene_type:complete